MKTLRMLLAGALAVLATAAHAGDWTENYAAALAQARKENKQLLLDFTGSDWCSWCKKIDAEVFAQPQFTAYAAQHFILVKLDYPRQRPLDDATKAQNAGLQHKYAIRGYPTLIVLDAGEHIVFQQVGYRDDGPAGFIARVKKGGNY